MGVALIFIVTLFSTAFRRAVTLMRSPSPRGVI